MIRIQLPDTEVGLLEQVLRTADDAKLRHRVQVVLMAHRGRRHTDIAADTGTSPPLGPALAQRLPRWRARPAPAPQG